MVRGHTPRPTGRTSNPNPPDGSVGIRFEPILSWTPGAGALSHDVYFGIESPGIFQGNQTGTTFEPGTLDYNRTYYWRIDERNRSGATTIGGAWTFTTRETGGVR
ncbi:MAG: hypothetical protein KAY65_01495 [Planctomycetes bacterium]|nr:hypothetical protein [Planctomycetota bacterium]